MINRIFLLLMLLALAAGCAPKDKGQGALSANSLDLWQLLREATPTKGELLKIVQNSNKVENASGLQLQRVMLQSGKLTALQGIDDEDSILFSVTLLEEGVDGLATPPTAYQLYEFYYREEEGGGVYTSDDELTGELRIDFLLTVDAFDPTLYFFDIVGTQLTNGPIPLVQIRGTVYDKITGEVISGAIVYAIDEYGDRISEVATTETDGTYWLKRLHFHTDTIVEAGAREFQSLQQLVALVHPVATGVDFELLPRVDLTNDSFATVSGRVLYRRSDEAGGVYLDWEGDADIDGVDLPDGEHRCVVYATDTAGVALNYVEAVETDENGNFTLTGLPNATVQIRVRVQDLSELADDATGLTGSGTHVVTLADYQTLHWGLEAGQSTDLPYAVEISGLQPGDLLDIGTIRIHNDAIYDSRLLITDIDGNPLTDDPLVLSETEITAMLPLNMILDINDYDNDATDTIGGIDVLRYYFEASAGNLGIALYQNAVTWTLPNIYNEGDIFEICGIATDIKGSAGEKICRSVQIGNNPFYEEPQTVFMDTTDYPISLSIGDIDGDGFDDIAVGNRYGGLRSGNVRLFLNDETGAFPENANYTLNYDGPLGANSALQTFDVEHVDLNNDGLLDIALVNCVEVSPAGDEDNLVTFIQNADGSFPTVASQTTETHRCPKAIDFGDFDGDGYQDALIAHWYNGCVVSLLKNNGSGTLEFYGVPHAYNTYHDSLFIDYDNDSDLDIAIAIQWEGTTGNANLKSTSVVIVENNAGVFTEKQVIETQSEPINLVAVDFNNDGLMDLASAHATIGSTISVMLNAYDSAHPENPPYATEIVFLDHNQTNSFDLDAGDFNGDGNQDLVVTNQNDNGISIFLGYGDGTFSDPMFIDTNLPDTHPNSNPLGSHPFDVKTSDLNSDGCIDLIVANGYEDNIMVYLAVGNLCTP
jgi:FG-GAP-like repeat/Carboxypeptidase regulatory-like domain/FG-GAP repeat